MDFTAAALAAAAGVDPWALHRRLAAGDPDAVRAAALGFRAAANRAAQAVEEGRVADRSLAGSYRNDGAAVFDTAASTARGVTLMGAGGEPMEEAARALIDVAAALAGHTAAATARIGALEADVARIVRLRNDVVAGALTPPDVAAAEQDYLSLAVNAVRAAGVAVQAEIDGYSAMLSNRGARLDELGYGSPGPPDQASPAEPADDDGLDELGDVAADVGNGIASLGNALVNDAAAVGGLALGAGAVLAGGAVALGGGGLSVTGVGAVAGVPAAGAAGAALAGVGGALVVASANEIAGAASGPDRITPIERPSEAAKPPMVRRDFRFPGAGRSGAGVKDFVGPADAVVRGAGPGRVYVTDGQGRVILDITRDRVKEVIPGRGFVRGDGRKAAPNDEQLRWIDELWSG